jgi:hypothetical protein
VKELVEAGDRFLLFFKTDEKGVLRVAHFVNLSHAWNAGNNTEAIDTNFQVLTDADAVLRTVRARLAAHPDGTPTRWHEYPGNRFDVEIPEDSSAWKRIFAGSTCYLLVPDDLKAGVIARRDVRRIVEGIRLYYNENHAMPSTGNAAIIGVLNGGNANHMHYGVVFDPKRDFNEARELLDPWGTPYRIDTSNPKFPWAYSCGPDKKDDGGAPGSDDIVSW